METPETIRTSLQAGESVTSIDFKDAPAVCPSVENPYLLYQDTGNSQGSTHPRPADCDNRQSIQTRPDHSDRMVPSPRGLPSHLLPVAATPSGPVCHQVQQQTATVCVTGSRLPGLDSGCTQIWTHMPSHQQPSWAKWWRS